MNKKKKVVRKKHRKHMLRMKAKRRKQLDAKPS